MTLVAVADIVDESTFRAIAKSVLRTEGGRVEVEYVPAKAGYQISLVQPLEESALSWLLGNEQQQQRGFFQLQRDARAFCSTLAGDESRVHFIGGLRVTETYLSMWSTDGSFGKESLTHHRPVLFNGGRTHGPGYKTAP